MSTVSLPLGVGTREWRGLSRLRDYFCADNRRSVQTALGLIWLLDGGLQFESFMYSRGFIQQLASGAAGQPPWLASAIHWGARFAGGNPTLWNTLFALTQVGIGLGLLYRPTVKTALVISFGWALTVWVFGEGLGMLLANQAQPMTGAPGAVLLYALVGLIVWPNDRHGGLLGQRGARFAWAGLWLLMAWLWALGASSSSDATHDAILKANSGLAWLTSVQNTVARAAAGNGLEIAVMLGLLSAAIGVGVAAGWRPRLLLATSIGLALSYWLLTQGIGGIFAGGATDPQAGPLCVLLACAMYPLAGAGSPTAPHAARILLATCGVLGLLCGVGSASGPTGFTGVITTGGGLPLAQPAVYRSHDGLLNVTLTASEKRVEIAGKQVLAKVYNGSFVAPTLMLRPGDMVRLKLVNDLPEPTNLHFHGLEVSPSGHADNVFLSINPGQSFQYYFRLPRDAPTGTFWYHSHEMVPAGQMAKYPNDSSEEQVFDGLSGVIEVEGLPHYLPRPLRNLQQQYLELRDVQVVNGAIVDNNISSDAPTTRLVDGELDPKITIAPGQTQLWHVANIGADIFYDLVLPGHTFDVIAQDGHPVMHPSDQTSLLLPPGKRYDVLVRGDRTGTAPLETLYFDQGDDHYPQRTIATVITTGHRQAVRRWPKTIMTHQLDLAKVHAVRQRVVVFSENQAGTVFYVDGQSYNPKVINFHARLNTVEQWTIVNTTDEIHVFHMHTYPMQLVSVNGVPVTFNGYQDMIDLPIHGYVVMRVYFKQFTGITLFHCHIMAHEDEGMMANIQVSR